MTDKILRLLIGKLNKNQTNHLIYLKRLTPTVDFSKAWTKNPKPTDEITYSAEPHKVYFIKNNEGAYVAAVLDMENDLHWYVVSKHRRKGHLTKAMKSAILPHLFQNRSAQKITIDKAQIGGKHFKASEKVALSLGFIKDKESSYFLSNKICQPCNFDRPTNKLTEKRMRDLKKQLHYVACLLHIIQTEVDMNLDNPDFTEELGGIINELKEHPLKLENAWWNRMTKI